MNCFLCGLYVSEEDFCYGCKQYVCDECSGGFDAPMGSHDPGAHEDASYFEEEDDNDD